MWLFTRYGFLSVVRDVNNAGRVLIRARRRDHLERLCGRFGLTAAKIQETPENDYPFRLFVGRAVWIGVAWAMAEDIDYGNFKDEVQRSEGATEYERSLHSVWGTMHGIEEERPVKHWSIGFMSGEGDSEVMCPLSGDPTDADIEAARLAVEDRIGRKLPVDPRTGFPSFTIYADGEEYGGG